MLVFQEFAPLYFVFKELLWSGIWLFRVRHFQVGGKSWPCYKSANAVWYTRLGGDPKWGTSQMFQSKSVFAVQLEALCVSIYIHIHTYIYIYVYIFKSCCQKLITCSKLKTSATWKHKIFWRLSKFNFRRTSNLHF